MVHYVLSGTDVDFPHQAYGTQLVLMGKVIAAADSGGTRSWRPPRAAGRRRREAVCILRRLTCGGRR